MPVPPFAWGAAAVIAATLAWPATAQTESGQCILAGRLNDSSSWAPRFAGVELLGADGKLVGRAGRGALAGVRQVRLAQPALLSRCDGNAELSRADNDLAFTKAQVPAVSAGLVDVESVAFPKLRTGGNLVELKLRVPAQRVVMLMR